MIMTAFIFLMLFCSIYFEILIGSLGIIIPFTALTIFYFSITKGWITGMLLGLIAGTILDLLYGRIYLLSSFSMISIAGLSIFWLHQGDPESVLLHFLPGALIAFLSVFPILLLNTIFYGAIINNLFILTFSSISGAILLPIIIPFYDILAKKIGITQYKGAKSRALERRY